MGNGAADHGNLDGVFRHRNVVVELGQAAGLEHRRGSGMGNPQHAFLNPCLHRLWCGFSAEETAGKPGGLDDLGITRAAAKIVRQGLLDLLDARIRILVQQRLGRHDHPRRAEAALNGAGQHKGLLNEVGILGRPEPLDADDLGPLQFHHLGEAGTDRLAVHDDRAGAALPLPVAGLLGPGEAKVPAQIVK